METLIIIGCILWAASGLASFIYWWTKDYDLTIKEIFVPGILTFFAGPLAYLIGYSIHGKHRSVILKKRS
jgi:uncharacterized membrane protein YhfC